MENASKRPLKSAKGTGDGDIERDLFMAGADTKLEQLPEGCISHILAFTSPIDASRSTVVSKLFHSAADSDSVWARFLPPDYQEIISASTDPQLSFSSKKHIFSTLCHSPILVDHGTKSFQLDKATGKKCYMVRASELSIAWKDNPRYWSWISDPQSRFDDVACLISVFWFDIIGRLETRILSPNSTYAAYLVFKIGPDDYGLNQLFKSYVTLVPQGDVEDDFVDINNFKRLCFRPAVSRTQFPNDSGNQQLPRERGDGWMEIEMGDFTIPDDDEASSIARMQVKEVEFLNYKSGIIVEGIEVRPK